MELNKRWRTRRKRESKKPEPKHDVSTVDGIKRTGIKNFPGNALHSGKTMDLDTLKWTFSYIMRQTPISLDVFYEHETVAVSHSLRKIPAYNL